MFLDFPGLRAEQKITERKPIIIVQSKKSPRGRIFLVKCESNKRTNNRSVKLGRAGLFAHGSWSSPDSDWTVDCDTKQTNEETWEITPKKKLDPGDYGILFKDPWFFRNPHRAGGAL